MLHFKPTCIESGNNSSNANDHDYVYEHEASDVIFMCFSLYCFMMFAIIMSGSRVCCSNIESSRSPLLGLELALSFSEENLH